MMYDPQVWAQEGKMFCSAPWQDEEFLSALNVSPEKRLQFTGTTSKQKRTQKVEENHASLLSRIGPSPW